MLPTIDPISVAFTTSWRPSAEREQGDDQLRGVAEGDVQQAADPGTGARGQLLGRAAHQRRGGDDAERRGDEDRSASLACASSSAIAIGMNGARR